MYYYREVDGKKVRKCRSCGQEYNGSYCMVCHAERTARYRQKGYAGDSKSRRRWTAQEDEMILRQDITDLALSHKIMRSVSAISVRRYKLRKRLPT